ncbi:MAG TPA: Uma2 family endonuclease [Pyrinomonadaceae bacterium]|nr:Uma2 family endonuclease [Pyrinomonadaceae bacterium]
MSVEVMPVEKVRRAPVERARRAFNVSEYYRLGEIGVLKEDDRVELIEGDIFEMSPIGKRHAACVLKISTHLSRRIGDSALVSVQNPVRLDDLSEPVPDVAVLRPRADFYAEAHPTPEDVLLVIEVSDTTVRFDRNKKVPLYARAGVPEAWLVNLSKNEVEVYSRPEDGVYQQVRRVRRGGRLRSSLFPSLALSADDVLP